MRNLHKMMLLAVVTMAALTSSAPTASGQQHPGYHHSIATVELTNESTGQHCSNLILLSGHEPVVGVTCTLHLTSVGAQVLYLHNGLAEVPFSSCSSEFEAVFHGTGEGFIYNHVLAPEGGVCGREPCDEAGAPGEVHENIASPVELFEAFDGSGLKLGVRFCLYAHRVGSEGGAGLVCHVILNVAREEHSYQVSTLAHDGGGNGGAQCEALPIELVGSWVTDPTAAHPDSIEIVHRN